VQNIKLLNSTHQAELTVVVMYEYSRMLFVVL